MSKPGRFNSYFSRSRIPERFLFAVGGLATAGVFILSARPVGAVAHSITHPEVTSAGIRFDHDMPPVDIAHDLQLMALAGGTLAQGIIQRRKRHAIEFDALTHETALEYAARVGAEQLHTEIVRYLRDNSPPGETD